MCTRIRAAMNNEEFKELMGVVEVDESFVGGKNYNRHANKRVKGTGGFTGKTGVIGAISRKGNVVCQVIENTDTTTLDRFVRKAVGDNIELIATDEHSGYRLLKPSGLPHESIAHGQGEYVRGIVHTNNIESFWALLKRGIMGSFHHVSKKYLPLYLAEFSFRHNHRKDDNIFDVLIAGC
jgi:transposase-like protein